MLRLTKYEVKKLFSNKIMIFFLIVIVLVNIWLITKDISETMVDKNTALERLISSYLENPEGTSEYINNYMKEYSSVAYERNKTGNKDIPFPDDVFIKNLKTGYDSDYSFLNAEYKNVINVDSNIKNKINKSIKIADSQIMEYEYLGYSESSFDYAYQLGVSRSYKNLTEIEFPIVHISGYNVLMFYEGFGVISMIAMIICGILFVIPDKTVGMYPVMMVSKNGRTKTFFAKLIASFFFCFIICATLDITALLAVGFKLGLSGGNAPIQMLNSFYPDAKDTFLLCPYTITIFQGFLLTCLIRLFSCFAFLCIIILISNLFSSYTFSIIIGILFTGFNFLLAKYNYLNAYHPLANLNFFVNINGYKPINYWRGIKIFNSAVPVLKSTILLFSFLIVVSVIISFLLFIKGKGFNFRFLTILSNKIKNFFKNKLFNISNKVRSGRHLKKPKTVFMYECKKIFTFFALAVIIIAFALNIYMSVNTFGRGISFEEKVYDLMISEYEGEWTPEKHQMIYTRYRDTQSIISSYDKMVEAYSARLISPAEFSEYYSKYEAAKIELTVIKDIYSISKNLKEIHETSGLTVYLINEIGWVRLFSTNFSFIYLIVFIVVFSNIFSIEYKEDFGKILRSSKFRGKSIINRIVISLVFTTLFIAILEAIQFAALCNYFSLDYPYAVSRSISIFTNSTNAIYDKSLLTVLILRFIRTILLSNIIVLFISSVSRLTKKLMPTLAIGATVSFAPALFTYFGFDFMNGISLVRFLGRM